MVLRWDGVLSKAVTHACASMSSLVAAKPSGCSVLRGAVRGGDSRFNIGIAGGQISAPRPIPLCFQWFRDSSFFRNLGDCANLHLNYHSKCHSEGRNCKTSSISGDLLIGYLIAKHPAKVIVWLGAYLPNWISGPAAVSRKYLSPPAKDPSQLHSVREGGLAVGYGDGFLYLRGAIWWMCYVGPQGRVRATTGVRDRHTAELILRSKANAYTGGQATFAKASTQLVAEYKMYGRRNLSEVKRCLEGHILPVIGELDLARIGTATVERYTLARLTEGAAPATVNRELTIIRGAYALAQRRHPEMALAQWRVPSLPEHNVRRGFLVYPEYRKLLALLPAHVKPVVICAYYWGCRRGELLGDCRAGQAYTFVKAHQMWRNIAVDLVAGGFQRGALRVGLGQRRTVVDRRPALAVQQLALERKGIRCRPLQPRLPLAGAAARRWLGPERGSRSPSESPPGETRRQADQADQRQQQWPASDRRLAERDPEDARQRRSHGLAHDADEQHQPDHPDVGGTAVSLPRRVPDQRKRRKQEESLPAVSRA
ncbi:hypothetical protein LCGC14_1738360, partial [marine sediment metagenome]